MKKLINILIALSLVCSNLMAIDKDNKGDIQVFMSKTNGLTTIGETEELFTGTQEDFSKESGKILTREESYAVVKDSNAPSVSTESALNAGAAGAISVTGAVVAASYNSGKSVSEGMKSGGLIGLAVVGVTVGAVAIFNGTQGMRDDHKYISLYRNKVGNDYGLIYVLVVANNTLTKEEVQKLANEKIKG